MIFVFLCLTYFKSQGILFSFSFWFSSLVGKRTDEKSDTLGIIPIPASTSNGQTFNLPETLFHLENNNDSRFITTSSFAAKFKQHVQNICSHIQVFKATINKVLGYHKDLHFWGIRFYKKHLSVRFYLFAGPSNPHSGSLDIL